eukprot:Em0022g618a
MLQKSSKVLYGPGQQPLEVMGQFTSNMIYNGLQSEQVVFVMKELKKNLLGLLALTALQLVSRLDGVDQYEKHIYQRFPNLFQGLGTLGVPKKDNTVHICVDLKPLNENVQRENFPLPKVDETLPQLAEATAFSKIDANSGFWQIPLAKESHLLPTFITPFGRYCFTKLPFGISSAPELFQRRMDGILSETEQRYAQIEKEAQAIVWACDKFSCYILGKHFEIETDHKPLVPLLSTKHLDTLPPGILRFRLRLARFDYSINHVPGKSLLTADALSRAPCPPSSMENESITNSDVEVFVGAIISTIPITELDFMKYHTGQLNDPICIRVKQYCVSGWPAIQNIGVELIPYWRVRDDLSVCKDLLLYGTRIVVPTSLKSLTLQKLHQGHLGIQRCHLRAVSSVWWPGSSQQIYQMLDTKLIPAWPYLSDFRCNDQKLKQQQKIHYDRCHRTRLVVPPLEEGSQPIKKPEDATADVTNEAEARVPEKPEGTRAIVTKETENRPPTQPRSPIKTQLQTAQSSDHPIDLTSAHAADPAVTLASANYLKQADTIQQKHHEVGCAGYYVTSMLARHSMVAQASRGMGKTESTCSHFGESINA